MSKKDLDSNKDLSYVTSKVVDRVIEWKERRELWKKRKFVFDVFALILMFYFIIKVYFLFTAANDLNQFYSVLLSPNVRKAIIILIPTLIIWKFCNDKYREYDIDYETLRKEAIDRADELWFHFPEDWSNRQDKLKEIDKAFKVNLFYKKK